MSQHKRMAHFDIVLTAIELVVRAGSSPSPIKAKNDRFWGKILGPVFTKQIAP